MPQYFIKIQHELWIWQKTENLMRDIWKKSWRRPNYSLRILGYVEKTFKTYLSTSVFNYSLDRAREWHNPEILKDYEVIHPVEPHKIIFSVIPHLSNILKQLMRQQLQEHLPFQITETSCFSEKLGIFYLLGHPVCI